MGGEAAEAPQWNLHLMTKGDRAPTHNPTPPEKEQLSREKAFPQHHISASDFYFIFFKLQWIKLKYIQKKCKWLENVVKLTVMHEHQNELAQQKHEIQRNGASANSSIQIKYSCIHCWAQTLHQATVCVSEWARGKINTQQNTLCCTVHDSHNQCLAMCRFVFKGGNLFGRLPPASSSRFLP